MENNFAENELSLADSDSSNNNENDDGPTMAADIHIGTVFGAYRSKVQASATLNPNPWHNMNTFMEDERMISLGLAFGITTNTCIQIDSLTRCESEAKHR